MISVGKPTITENKPKQPETIKVTEAYIELEYKAKLFAEVFDYDYCITSGYFYFYNAPCFRSFAFTVDPDKYDDEPAITLNNEFQKRLKS